MIRQVLDGALKESNLSVNDLDGFLALPSLAEHHIMEAHFQATSLGLFTRKASSDAKRLGQPSLLCRTIDTGGGGPVSALLQAQSMIQHEGLNCVAVVAADSVGSMDSRTFLQRVDNIFGDESGIPSPIIPNGYDRYTQYQMQRYGLTRDQLRMVVCLQSFHASRHKESLLYQTALELQPSQQTEHMKRDTPKPFTALDSIQQAPSVAPNISLLECAYRADGAGCIILTSESFLNERLRTSLEMEQVKKKAVTILGSGESSGPLVPPAKEQIGGFPFGSDAAMTQAYRQAGSLKATNIDFFALYDCFPICLIRALEATGICSQGDGGNYIEAQYSKLMNAVDSGTEEELIQDPTFFPVNTHGGLLCYGAPWEVPAMYNIIEACQQLNENAVGRQIDDCKRALVYGNGGIFSSSAVAILGKATS
ncbi:unnamed protein product [Cylindrotheca closterium]|uniref:Thiolase C-terminal domain-containing protein n=1 Tax=Cylindrotheca closterium TaxID=2856 RepID=A0AAD2PW29_9STRA|nr:unnamed protein product [Cylindrotheca closterium]